jgi:hypothetical protein
MERWKGKGEEECLKGSHLKCWPLTRSGEKYLKTITIFLLKKRHGPLGVHGLAYRVAIDAVSRHTRCTVAEICNLNQAVTVEQHVAGLDVAVNGVFRLVQIPSRVKLEIQILAAGPSQEGRECNTSTIQNVSMRLCGMRGD